MSRVLLRLVELRQELRDNLRAMLKHYVISQILLLKKKGKRKIIFIEFPNQQCSGLEQNSARNIFVLNFIVHGNILKYYFFDYYYHHQHF